MEGEDYGLIALNEKLNWIFMNETDEEVLDSWLKSFGINRNDYRSSLKTVIKDAVDKGYRAAIEDMNMDTDSNGTIIHVGDVVRSNILQTQTKMILGFIKSDFFETLAYLEDGTIESTSDIVKSEDTFEKALTSLDSAIHDLADSLSDSQFARLRASQDRIKRLLGNNQLQKS